MIGLKIICALVVMIMLMAAYLPALDAVECNFSVGNKKGSSAANWEEGFKGSAASGLDSCASKCASTCQKKDGCMAVDAHITSSFWGGKTCNCYGYDSHPELESAQSWRHLSCS